MKVLRNFNNISDELRATIPEFKEGTIRTFKMLTGVVNNDPSLEERLKTPVFYGAVQIPTVDKIKDPYIKNKAGEVVGGYVDIGVVEKFDTATENVERTILFVPGHGIGTFCLSGDKLEDVELFEYLWLCKYNKKNCNPRTEHQALFEEIEYIDAKEIVAKKRAAAKEALELLETIGEPTIEQEEMALENPEKFLETYKTEKVKRVKKVKEVKEVKEELTT